MTTKCKIIPESKTCPSVLPQLTAEVQTHEGIRSIIYEETLDPIVLDIFKNILKTVKERWAEKLEGKTPISLIAYILGKWGYGKTHYAIKLQQMANEENVLARYIIFDNIIEKARKGNWRSPSELRDMMAKMMIEGASDNKPIIVILDEFESLVSVHWVGSESERMLVDAFIELYQALVNPDVEYLSGLRGRLHLVLLLTPAASIKLEQLLDEPLKKGKIKSRYDFIIYLRPLTKDESLRLLKRYTAETVGVSLTDVVARIDYINLIYYITGGIPRILLSLLRELGRVAEQQCQNKNSRCCVCPLEGKDFLMAIARADLVNSEGETYKPVQNFLLSLATTLSSDMLEALLTLKPVDNKMTGIFEKYGVKYEKAAVYGPMPYSVVARWIDNITQRLCHSRGDCIEDLSQALQYLILVGDQGYYIILPDDIRIINDWLYMLGWSTGQLPPTLDAHDIAPKAERQKAYVLDPRTLRSLYKSPIEGIFDFIIDPRLRIEVQRKLEIIGSDSEKLMNYATMGLTLMLNTIGDRLISELIVEGSDIFYRYEEGGVGFRIPIEIKSYNQDAIKNNSIIFVMGKRRPHTTTKGRQILIGPKEGELRLLAAVALALDMSNNPYKDLDMVRLDELGRRLVEALELSRALRKIASNLVEMGIIVRPIDHADVFKTGSVNERFNALSDVIKYLAVLGGRSRYVTINELVDFIWNLSYATPYGRSNWGWCGIKFMEIGKFSDMKDPETRERLEKIITNALNALVSEGLVSKILTPEGLGYKITFDSLTLRLLELNDNILGEHKIKDHYEILKKYFVFPSDKVNKNIAVKRLMLRKDLLVYLDYNYKSDQELLGNIEKILLNVNNLKNKLNFLYTRIEEDGRQIEKVTGKSANEVLGTIVICKGAGRGNKASCKIIDLNFIKNSLELINNTGRKLKGTPEGIVRLSNDYLKTLERLSTAYLDILGKVMDLVKESINKAIININTIKNYKETIKMDILQTRLAEANQLNELIDTVIQGKYEEIYKEFKYNFKEIIKRAQEVIDLIRKNKKDKVKSIAINYNFDLCYRGGYRRAALEYNPLVKQLYSENLIFKSLQSSLTETERLLKDIHKSIEKFSTFAEHSILDIKQIERTIINKYYDLISKDYPSLQALANAISLTIDYIRSDIKRIQEQQMSIKMLKEKNTKLKDDIKHLTNKIENLNNGLNKLEFISLSDPTIYEKLSNLKRKVKENKNLLARLEGLINQHLNSCSQFDLLRMISLNECRKNVEKLEKQLVDLSNNFELLANEYNNIVKLIKSHIKKDINRMKKLLGITHSIYLRELQLKRIEAEEAVILTHKGLEILSQVKSVDGFEEIKFAIIKLNEAKKLYQEARRIPGSEKVELFLEILDILEERKKIGIGELISLLKNKVRTNENISDLLEDLDTLFKNFGVRLTIIMESHSDIS
ncbi:MAG: hypothetical protein GSR85_05830 [Desulfurococcales archaeon]|nr:hypothetical protein [Desulfurococcales archaeon]